MESVVKPVESYSFVVYDERWHPIAFMVKQNDNEFTEEEMKRFMEMFPEAKENNEELIVWFMDTGRK